MELSSVAKFGLLGAIALLDIIALGLLAYAVDYWSGRYFGFYNYHPSSVNFMLFNTVWTILVLVYLAVVPLCLASAYQVIVALPLLAITTIFWFAGSIAIAAFLGVDSCSGGHYCSVYKAAQAATAFGFFIWALFTVLLIFEVLGYLRHGTKRRANADMTGTQMTTQMP